MHKLLVILFIRNEKYVFWYVVFKVLKVLLRKKKIQLVYQFLYFLLFYIASALTSANIII